MFNKNQYLFILIFIEGYLSLSNELLYIRQLTPYIGSNIEIISIIISAVLLPLSIGYYYGGNKIKNKFRNKLLLNIIQISLFINISLSYIFLESFFKMLGNDINVIYQSLIFSILFIVYPFFLLGQTIPLVSNYFKKNQLSKFTGKLLFFSTFGSFLGSIFTTTILMNYIGVNNTINLNIIILFLLFISLNKNKQNKIIMTIITFLLLVLNSNLFIEKNSKIVLDNSYSIVKIIENEKVRILSLNNSYCAVKDLKSNTSMVWYINKINKLILNNNIRENNNNNKLDILVIGSAGFQIGEKDKYNNYLFIDVNKDILKISELYFNKEKLNKNKKFKSISTRSFFNNNKKKFDFIILDAYSNNLSIPYQLLTIEFLNKIKKSLKVNGFFAANIITNPFFKNKFSIKIHNSFNKVFYPIFRYTPDYLDLNQFSNPKYMSNILYIYKNDEIVINNKILLNDNKNH
jgi:predicted membrane-bound spermidine synthase